MSVTIFTMAKTKDCEISDFASYHDAVQSFRHATVVYRGQRSLEWPLTPKIGRYKKLKSSDPLREERTVLRFFKERAIAHLQFQPAGDWDWLALAQHHGLPTRLLDWSRNPLVAAYFAVEENHDADSVVYAFRDNTFIDIQTNADPFSCTTVGRFLPQHISPRIVAQTGVFTAHPDIHADMCTDRRIVRIIIRKEFRQAFKSMLYKYGIHRAALFPDLDGLAKHIEWLRTGVY